MHMTANPAERTAPSSAPLRPRPDQAERWITHERAVPFDDAAHAIVAAHREDGERGDVVAHQLRTWAFGSTDGRTTELTRVPFEGRPEGAPLPLRELAFSQLCTKVGAPAHYIRGLPMRLQVACMNWGLVRQESPALLRLAGGEVRAVLSDRYAAADDHLLLEMVADTLDKTGYRDDALVRAVAVGPHTLLRVTLPNEGTPVKVGDVIEHGVDIGNSELGLRSVQVTPVTHRLVCLNGMRAWKSEAALRMRHVGDPERLRDQLRDAIPVAFAEARGDIERWKRSVELLVDSALDEIEGLRGLGLSQAEVQSVGQTFAREHVLPERSSAVELKDLLRVRTTAFDVANAITATARERESVPARLALEEVGHRYLASAA
jgi:hypothetical protein